MCGITGALDLRGQREFPESILWNMTAALAHRGPDATAMHREPGLAMGVRRLALVDPDGGAQPMRHETGITVAFNGEWYTFKEERARLNTRGYRFQTGCDTEVWLHGWHADGPDILQRVRGQFAVALWDPRSRMLCLARDRFGICPLYIAEARGWLLWASEIKALLATGLIPARLDGHGIDHLFTFMCANPGRSSFENINPIRPGHRLLLTSDGRRSTERFAGITFPAQGSERGTGANRRERNALVEELEDHLTRAVTRRKQAATRVGVYLSGGIDSSLLTMLSSREPAPVTKAFTIQLNAIGRDESGEAAQTARAAGMEHVVVPVNARHMAALFPRVVRAAEAPILDHADTALLALSRAVRAMGIKAVLTGEGADEAFAGYPWYRPHALPFASRFLIPALVRGIEALPGNIPGMTRSFTEAPFRGLALSPVYALMSRIGGLLYSRKFREQLSETRFQDAHQWDPRALASMAPLHRSLWSDYQLLLPGHLLMDKGDRVSMASGVEARYPFLDEDLVEFAAALAPELKQRYFRDKWILRRLAAKTPGLHAARSKHMFRAAPTIHDENRPAWVDQLLSPPSLQKTGFFDHRLVKRALEVRRSSRPSLRKSLLEAGLTGVVSAQLLHHQFCGGGLCDLPNDELKDE